MTKQELTNRLSEQTGLSLKEAKQIVTIFFNHLSHALIADDRIEIRGFGSFKIKEYKGFMGRNPKTGEGVTVSSKKLPFFKVGKSLKDQVDSD